MTAPEDMDLSQCKVLVFHQSGVQNKHIFNVLRMCGLGDITRADTIEEAISQVIRQHFDVILVTHFSEAKDTTLLLDELASHQTAAGIPIVALTEKSTVKDLLRIMAKGVDEVLSEPLSPQDLETKILKVLLLRAGGGGSRDRVGAGFKLLADDQAAEAREYFQHLSLDPECEMEALLGLCEANMALADWDLAQNSLKLATDLARQNEDQVSLHRNMARVLHAYGRLHQVQGQGKKAVKSFFTALKMNPYNLENLTALMNELESEDDVEGVLEVIREAKADFLPYSPHLERVARGGVALCTRLESLGLTDTAGRLYLELLDLKHEDSEIHLKLADHFLAKKEPHRVVLPLLEVSARVKDADLLYHLGTLLMNVDPFALAEALPKPSRRGSLVEMLKPDKVQQAARQALSQAMLLEPDEPRHRLGLASLELRQGNTQAAAEVLKRLKEINLEDVRAYVQVVTSLMEEKAWDLAEEWLRDAQAAFPGHPAVAKLAARYHLDRGEPYKAITALKKGLSATPGDPAMLLTLAETYLGAKEYDDAVFYFERAAKLLPDNRRVQKGLNRALSAGK
ncbi:MAG: tetratricopeptide repeat protein [Deltaproteobacteria bacterium]|nr:tetratricopeptide repeat protein [Deltaproteobacteria bacterium]